MDTQEDCKLPALARQCVGSDVKECYIEGVNERKPHTSDEFAMGCDSEGPFFLNKRIRSGF
jgi:hypothetical protein